MFDINVTQEQFNYARTLVLNHNFGVRGYGDGNKDEQFTGLLGQTVFADLLGSNRPRGDIGFDGGIDFIVNGIKIDIKTMTRTVPVKSHYVHNFIGYQLKYETQGYVFASYNKRTNIMTICGYVTKEQFIERAKFYKKGELRYRDDGTSFPSKAPLYEIMQSDLEQASSMDVLVSIISKK